MSSKIKITVVGSGYVGVSLSVLLAQNNDVTVLDIDAALGESAVMSMQDMQAGDVPVTYADINNINTKFGFSPKTSIEDGIFKFVEWYRSSV